MRGHSSHQDALRAAAEVKFRDQVATQGGTVLGEYMNASTPVLVRCARGHLARPAPSNVRKGKGICRTCAGQNPALAEAAFRDRVTELGGTVLGTYVKGHTPILVRCKAGHEWMPRPASVQQGQGICGVCAEWDPVTSWAAFHARVAELGGTVLGEYAGAHTPVWLRCKAGHDCWPTPDNVRRGKGICRRCAGKTWNAFYVVTSAAGVKFGITADDPRPRLYDHRAVGYRTTVRLLTELRGDIAPQIEQAVLAALRLAEMAPVRGREYFDLDALPLVLDIVDNYPLAHLAATESEAA